MEQTSPDKTALMRSRLTALMFATLTILSLLLLVYAFIQKAESDRLRLEVMDCEKKYNEVVSQLEQEKVRAEEDFSRAERLYQEAKALEELAKQNTK